LAEKNIAAQGKRIETKDLMSVSPPAAGPGFPLQSFLPLCGKKGFPLQSRLHGRAAILLMQNRDQPSRPTGWLRNCVCEAFTISLLAHAA
jgi:hypothetical protein